MNSRRRNPDLNQGFYLYFSEKIVFSMQRKLDEPGMITFAGLKAWKELHPHGVMCYKRFFSTNS
jgi:hypothetical protein